MILSGKAVYLGREEKVNKKGEKYFIMKFIDDYSRIVQVMSKDDIDMDKYRDCEISIDLSMYKNVLQAKIVRAEAI